MCVIFNHLIQAFLNKNQTKETNQKTKEKFKKLHTSKCCFLDLCKKIMLKYKHVLKSLKDRIQPNL